MRRILGNSAAYRTRLQSDGDTIVELIDLSIGQIAYHWNTGRDPLTYTLSGAATNYDPFPGKVPNGIEEGVDLGVSVIEFVLTNSGDILRNLLAGGSFAEADLKVGRVFPDTPDLGRLELFIGRVGDYGYNRSQLRGQARNTWDGLATRFPFLTYEDKCVWRFGGLGCGFNTSSITLSVSTANIVVASSTRLNIILSSGYISQSYANERFDFGRMTVTGGVNSGQVRTIRQHTGDWFALSHPLPFTDLSNIQFDVFPGCRKRILEDCHSLYNNTSAFFGFPWIPVQEQAF